MLRCASMRIEACPAPLPHFQMRPFRRASSEDTVFSSPQQRWIQWPSCCGKCSCVTGFKSDSEVRCKGEEFEVAHGVHSPHQHVLETADSPAARHVLVENR